MSGSCAKAYGRTAAVATDSQFIVVFI
jgi:hypothetical protein